jgi:mono/diheme cytochrome c family protein
MLRMLAAKRLSSAALTATALFLLTACGGGSDSKSSDSAGAKVFADAGCGSCHALQAAGTKGTEGPDLDETKPDEHKVIRQVTNGGGGMPAFGDKLSETEIREVARFVAGSTRTATGGQSVAAAFEPDDTTIEDCDKTGDGKCYEQAFANMAFREGPKETLTLFDEKIKSAGPIEKNCHRIVHAIGAGSLAHFDGSVGKAFVSGSPSCTSGYYHGILERAFLGVDEQELGPASRRFCAGDEIRRTEFIAYQCVHGLGHGLMIYTGYDLPLSLRVCDRLNGDWDQRSCTGGVFMENIQSSYGVRSPWLKRNDLLYPCNSVAERHKYYCYDLLPSRVLPVFGHDFRPAIKWCKRAERRWRATCFQGLGREASGFTRLDPKRILAICAQAGAMSHECVIGASKDMTYTDVSPRRAKVLCNTAPAGIRAYCWEGIGLILGSLNTTTEQRTAACDRATTTFRKACYRGANITGS